MKRRLLFTIYFFFSLAAVFMLAKVYFMFNYSRLYTGCTAGEIAGVFLHGLKMDCAVAGYLTVPVVLWILITVFSNSTKLLSTGLKAYFTIIAALISVIVAVDSELYLYWDFRLDVTPLFYFKTDPQSALASVSWWTIFSGLVVTAVAAFLIYRYFAFILKKTDLQPLATPARYYTAGVLLLSAGVLIIPIRGGFGVATVNLSSAYFSNNMRLNHAAVNPAFSLLYSALHQQSFDRMFRFMGAPEAARIMARELSTTPCDSTGLLLNERPDIYIIILESFSDHLLPAAGGDSIAVGLDSIARSGLLFFNCFASSFRTDRGLTAILNAFPAAPTTSLLKMPEKTRHLPSLAATLGENGYSTRYFYGGDASFANQLTYLRNTGFNDIVTENDFPQNQRQGKWGVPDHYLTARVSDELAADTTQESRLWVIQTSSSHEPFEVPYSNPRWSGEPRLNAFSYVDSCVTALTDDINRLTDRASLVVLVADHWGCWPEDLAPDDAASRHRIPLILTGNALGLKGVHDSTVAQTDLVALLLDGMGINRDDFPFSRNPLDPASPRTAFMSTPNYVAVADSTATTPSIYIIDGKTFTHSGDPLPTDTLLEAYLQTVYDHIQDLH